ncbi:hypothetical protein vBEfaS95921_0006 [Enterococcus phage vB_EfaS_9592-1]|nr:hypothetical protein vBEfaS95921_0006 [Enterococcus phage vB_EfaS_9592-1]
MEFEIAIKTNGVQSIEFADYEKILNDAQKLADKMKEQEVTEETIKENKKLVATINKRIRELDTQRKLVKSEIMTPYEELNEKIQTLKDVLKEGIEHVNVQIKTFNEQEQKERTLQIEELFNKYHASYNAPQWLSFDNFIAKNRSLVTNKATSQKTITQAVVMYFELFKQDYSDLKEEVTDKDDRMAILIAYSRNGFNMSEAIEEFKEMKSERERLEAEQQRVRETKVPEIVILTGNEDKVVDKPVEVSYTCIKVKTSDLAKLKKLGIEWEEM